MSVCNHCKKERYCKKECRQAREARDSALKQAYFQALKKQGLMTAYQAVKAHGYKA